jgi:hypothetical protein
MILMLQRTLAAIAILAGALPTLATQLADPTFAGGVRAMPWTAHEFIGLEGVLREDVVAVGPDGSVYVAHENASDIMIVKLDANGAPVSGYTGAGVSRVPISSPFDLGAMHVEPGGALVLGGGRDLIRVDAAGRVDESFGSNGRMRIPYIPDGCATARIRQVLQADSGDWIAVGVQRYFEATTPTPTERGCTFFARVKANGAFDLTYGTNGNLSRPGFIAFDAAVRADGVVEAIGRNAGQSKRVVERYTPAGARLLAFGTFGAKELPDNGFAVSDSDGRILADGSLIFVAVTSQPTIVLHRYRPDHAFDALFAGLGRTILGVRDASIREVRVLPSVDGGFIVRAISTGAPGQFAAFYKIDARGLPDARFGDAGYARHLAASLSQATGWAMQPDGYVVFVAISHALIVPPPPPTVPPPSAFITANSHAARIPAVPDIVEFHNRITNHYFIAYDGLEAAGIDAGIAGPGWERTGWGLRPGGTTPVCRFYNPGANTHFFTIEPGECELVKRSPGWFYEGLGFFGTRLANGACPAGLRTVHRLFNNRQAFNDSNHRYIVDLSLVPGMVAQGWSLEGPVFCAKP